MNRQLSSRSRKQRLPCDQITTNFLQPNVSIDADYDPKDVFEDDVPSKKLSRISNASRKSSDTRDRQAQMDHNEQERGRRRELAIIYEMIRTCITEEDIRRHLDGTVKCPEKLSYPQLLQISCGIIEDEIHDMALYDRLVKEIEILEKECIKYNIPINDKPRILPPMQRHRIVADVVEDVLKSDKDDRNNDGFYAISQRERALEAHRKLTQLLGDESRLSPIASPYNNTYKLNEFVPFEYSRQTARCTDRRSTRRLSSQKFPLSSFTPKPCRPYPSPCYSDQNDFDSQNHQQRRFALVSPTSSLGHVPFPNSCSEIDYEVYRSPVPRRNRSTSVDQEIVDEFFATAINVEANMDDPDIGCIGNGDLDDYAFDTLFDVITTEPTDDLIKLPFKQ